MSDTNSVIQSNSSEIADAHKAYTVSPCPEGAEAYLPAEYFSGDTARRENNPFFIPGREKKSQSGVLIFSRAESAERALRLLRYFNPALSLIDIPARDCAPYERAAPAAEIVSRRLRGLRNLHIAESLGKPYVLVTSLQAVLQKIRKPEKVIENVLTLKPGFKTSVEKVARFLTANGYEHTGTVRERGEFAVRGGILDLFPSGRNAPYRLDFFGEEIEKIKIFDPATQISGEAKPSLTLLPASEILLDAETNANFRNHYLAACKTLGVSVNETLFADIMRGVTVQGIEHYAAFFDPDLTDLLSVARSAEVFAERSAFHEAEEYQTEIAARYKERAASSAVPEPSALYLSASDFAACAAQRETVYFTPHALPETDNIRQTGMKPAKNFIAERKTPGVNLYHAARDYMNEKREAGKKVYFFTRSEAGALRSAETFAESGLKATLNTKDFATARQADKSAIVFCAADLPRGFETENEIFLTEGDVFGEKTAVRKRRKGGAEKFLREISSLAPGDYVTHDENGIGKFLALMTLEVNQIAHECVQLEYAGGDKLYLPVENLDLLTRYGGEGATVQLDKLGGLGWQTRKARLKERITELAHALVKTAAERALKKAPVLTASHEDYAEFCSRFPYEETEDQLTTINAVLDDLASGRPSDRLICGDVGFGKTEAAIRAAFVAASSGYQTAIVVPTTLLARQHYAGFKRRFEGTGIEVGRLSRMVPAKETQETRERLEKGEVDVIIGTHALLSSKVKFKNLALLIIDEEQHFGVNHKEKLKSFKADLHVLTLTATPIPRTLQLSMGGARALSIIATPPPDRLAVKTFVGGFDEETVREALIREKNRGGQSFFVAPRISDLPEITDFLRTHVPEVSFVKGHGQMKPAELDAVMNDFYDGKYDVLVATTIIESGIDIPTANTMIVWEAEMFGLAQLYQIRGRIGRSRLRAFAYLTVPPGKKLTDAAEKRLNVLGSLDGLGAGFTVASHDADIRGAGNLLGDEQSGHIREVGFELYQQMLEEALETLSLGGKLDGDTDADNKSPQINIGLSAFIPEKYVSDTRARFSLYQRLAELNDRREIDSFAAELADRFGKIPDETENLLKTVDIKIACKKAGVSKLDAGEKGALLTFHKDNFSNPEGLLKYVAASEGKITLRPDQRLAVTFKAKDTEKRIKIIKKRLAEIADLRRLT